MIPFNDNWTFRRLDDPTPLPIRLPHDAMLVEGRSPASPGGAHSGYFLGGRYVYAKTWRATPSADRRQSLLFEGVYGDARILLNGREVGHSRSGYTEFEVSLDAALESGENVLEVHVDNADLPNSRWYTGSGIYRPVWLLERGPVAFAADGVRFRTESVDDSAVLHLTYELDGPAAGGEVSVAVRDGDEVVARATTDASATGELRLSLPDPRLWSPEHPHLYRAEVQLHVDGMASDERVQSVGLRTVEVDVQQGLRVNGQPVLLKGACVHHDHGPMGAATYRAAEYRRVRILKENGFNAVRSAHNPLSRDMLDACDELGMYVMDELFDIWSTPKTKHDSHQHFAETWQQDARAMVAKDRNHPSVIMYSIGNEITETATREGVVIAGELADFVRSLDDSRPVTIALNFLLNLITSYGKPVWGDDVAQGAVSSTVANAVANQLGPLMQKAAKLKRGDAYTRRAFDLVDVSGYNYAYERYRGDAQKHPQRIIVGSESYPGDLPKIWDLVESLPHVIGDFMWTGWDYLGEAGLGTWVYGRRTAPIAKPYPHVTAGCGAIDITGLPGAPALLARAVWGELSAPAIAVRPLHHAGQKVARASWRASDALESWSWRGFEGRTAEVQVYSGDDEVELLLNGRSLGRQPSGRARGCLARFTVPYEPGEITAVGYRAGLQTGTTSLRSASGPLAVTLTADRVQLDDSGQDLAFVRVELADADGVVDMTAVSQVRVEVQGPGSLVALGSAAPASEESFLSSERTTHYGRALAVVRADALRGTITVSATTHAFGSASLDLPVGCSGPIGMPTGRLG